MIGTGRSSPLILGSTTVSFQHLADGGAFLSVLVPFVSAMNIAAALPAYASADDNVIWEKHV
jgi:hypothetical protein